MGPQRNSHREEVMMTIEEARRVRAHLEAMYQRALRQNGWEHPETAATLAALRQHEDEAVDALGKPKVPGCRQCAVQSVFPGGPYHAGSPRCRCGSIASGGQRAHCSCSICF
jgi:hypothetical protein